ncbi:hypothetical protein HK100_011647 [Physocladia obscura]|uniref:Uncharacterized protein n=1 Tax=Physocladia obscura TaxID=109957 RepID=A0AAD5T3S5_9FUNG|nr:hypothetical protein HK100_011647 [Physocladia obscura]
MIKVFGRITGRYLSSTARNTNNATAGAKAEVLKANALEMNNLLPAIPGALTVQRVSGGGFVAGDTIHRGGLVLAAGRALLWDTAQFGLGNTASLVENHNDNKNSNNDITDASVFRSWDPAKVFAIFALLHPTPGSFLPALFITAELLRTTKKLLSLVPARKCSDYRQICALT